ncbi:Kinesin motor domain [Carpediemonas membranifera]|uniref:Kinesin-like protein n=1 Tax=Carpediemonas membranifera TaxID=201153 RepID=A0A8J6BA14_9EUKA|nr:Kinesin motor domain [Carpediemonas membranifera]|eukprot:KAG9396374.1 Kinesin motor domain [Carpediemonas membranifera]
MVRSSRPNSASSDEHSRIRVVVRVRPPIQEDYDHSFEAYEECVNVIPHTGDNPSKFLTLTRSHTDERDFMFDLVLGSDIQQSSMYGVVAEDIVNDVLQGFNGTVMAYGQTGTGKTHTIFGDIGNFQGINASGRVDSVSAKAGVIPRAVQQIFDHIEQNQEETEFQVTLSYTQLYKENIYDLLDEDRSGKILHLRESSRTGVYVDGLTALAVTSGTHLLDIVSVASKRRVMAGTSMNQLSSRSHVIMFITVEQRPKQTDPMAPDPVRRGVLAIVDLAGSERVSKTMSEGSRLDEAKKINQSLSALGNCVAALSSGSGHVPLRDSKLTRLLTDSLGGNTKTVICATVGPAECNYDETYSTLLFASRCMNVRTHATINEVSDFKTLNLTLQQQLAQAVDSNSGLRAKNEALEARLAALETGAGVVAGAPFGGKEKEVMHRFSEVIVRMQAEIRKQRTEASRREQEHRRQWRELAYTLASHPALGKFLAFVDDDGSEPESAVDDSDSPPGLRSTRGAESGESETESEAEEQGAFTLLTPAQAMSRASSMAGSRPASRAGSPSPSGVDPMTSRLDFGGDDEALRQSFIMNNTAGLDGREYGSPGSPQSIFEDDTLTDTIRRSTRFTRGQLTDRQEAM